MVPINDSLSELSDLSKQLNTETDALNDVIEAVEARLAKMQVGVSVWDDTLLDKSVESTCAPGGSNRVGIAYGYVIGYVKLADGWRIASKAVKEVSGFYEGDSECPYADLEDESAPTPLLKAPRHVRVEAAGQLEALIVLLKRRVESFIQDIEKSKNLIEEK